MLTEGGAYAFRKMQTGATATGDGYSMTPLTINGGSYALLTAQVVGISGDTITWEGTIDEENWVALPALNVATREVATTATADGIYRLVVTSLVAVRARVSTYGAGTIWVYGLLTASGEPGFLAEESGVTDHALLDNLDYASAGHTGFEASGTAAAAIGTHVGEADPHTQYALESALGTMATATETNYLLADGSRTGATSQGQLFNNPVGVGATPSYMFDANGDSSTNGFRARSATYVSIPNPGSVVNVAVLNSRGFNFSTDTQTVSASWQPTFGIGMAINRNDPLMTLKNAGAGAALLVESGKVGFGYNQPDAQLHVHTVTELAGTTNSVVMLLSISGDPGTTDPNRYANRQWLRRDTTGTDWTTTRWHDAISIGGSFVTPNSTTKCFWERDVFDDLQVWGTGSAAYMTLAASGLTIAGNGTATKLVADDTNVGTSSIQNAVTMRSTNAGTPGAGFGVGFRAGLKSSTTADQDAGRLTWEWVTATHASRASRGKLSAYYTSTEQTAMTWDGDTGGVKLAFYGGAPVAKAAAYTQTYSTADRTLAAYTADNESAAYTGIDNAQAGSVYAQLTDLNALRTAYENLRAFVEDLAQHHNSLLDDMQALNLVG